MEKKTEQVKVDGKTKINTKTHFLTVQCKHKIVRDYVDITPDKGCNIKYCSLCGVTF